MNQTLTSIIETGYSSKSDIRNKTFSEENIFEEVFDCWFFSRVKFIDCSFTDCHLVGTDLDFCIFESCIFDNTIIRKCSITDCVFKNCQFIDSELSPRVEFFRTLFTNSQFSNVDLSSSSFFTCAFVEINLIKTKFQKTSFIDLKANKITFNAINNITFDQTTGTVGDIIVDDSGFFPKGTSWRPQVDLDYRIRRSYLILFIISSLGLLTSLIAPIWGNRAIKL